MKAVIDFNGNKVHFGVLLAVAFSYGSNSVELRLGRVVGFPTQEAGTEHERQQIEVKWGSSSKGHLPSSSTTKIYVDVPKYMVIPDAYETRV